MTFYHSFENSIQSFFSQEYGFLIDEIDFQLTRKEFEGDITIVVFPYLKKCRVSPKELANQLGVYLESRNQYIKSYNVVGGFLNLSITDEFYFNTCRLIFESSAFGFQKTSKSNETVLVEFSSPNTNKPLHLGHIRNNLLGHAVANILEANGKNVRRVQIVNDRGIHICKSMVAWKKFAKKQTPKSTQTKGDHFVGQYYVTFEKEYKKQIKKLIDDGFSESDAKQKASLMIETQSLLRKWESGDPSTIDLWKQLNHWVSSGFDQTYEKLGVSFDKIYYESQTYLLGRKIVDKGLKEGILYQREDGSIWIDLTQEGLDEKLLIRSDGTSVYMTQDLGTAVLRSEDFPTMNSMIYVVGNEQNYHFQVLFLILQKLNYQWAKNLIHLSYGMVDLPFGKMKSREGTVVDADELIEKMVDTAKAKTQETGKVEHLDDDQKQELYSSIGLGALKYQLLKIDPKKRILFNPNQSIDFQGNTGTFIQYAYARIHTMLSKTKKIEFLNTDGLVMEPLEKEIINLLMLYPQVLFNAAEKLDPSLVANYLYDLVRHFNRFYQNIPILSASHSNQMEFRTTLSKTVAHTIKSACSLLGIEVPNQM
ncbi:MAG: arginine--tRNA ligase [Flavobacteriaceae bacterium]|nr:arginine--tRNA ligase [Flavobacteriaceae bacterium]MCY4266302.1 arginine--tRNA ligase [Flavobacteriaceae bacterium]MCY4299223.1 arginine--tRNA ligase [Flavobacteriaceae bacterium]